METLFQSSRASILAIGILGNIITLVVFSRPAFITRSRHPISTIYSRSLTLSDCYITYQLLIDLTRLIFDLDLTQLSPQLAQFVFLAFSSTHASILLVFSLDKLCRTRLNTTAYFYRLEKLTNRRLFHYILIFAVLIFNFSLYSMFVVVFSTTHRFNSSLLVQLGDVVCPVYLIEAVCLPFGLILLASILTARSIHKSSLAYTIDSSRRRARDLRLAYTSVCVNLTQVVFKLPFVVSMLVVNYGLDVNVVVSNTASILFYMTSCVNILVHVVSDSVFRRELVRLVRAKGRFRRRERRRVWSVGVVRQKVSYY